MAARFWVAGGTGNWSSSTNWATSSGGASGASAPGSADTAAFDASSGSGTATVDSSVTVQTLTCTGFTGTLAFGTNTISLNSTGTIFTGATTMTITGTPLIICTNSSATSRTITPTAVTEANSISFRITGGTGGLALTAGSYRDLDFTDGTNPTGYAGALGNAVQTIYGSFKASTGMTRTAGTSGPAFAATSGTKTITTAGVTFDCPFTFNGIGGTWQLQDALTIGSTRPITLTNGTLDLSSYTLTSGSFTSTNSNVRTLAFGTGKIVLTGNAANIFTTATATNLTVTGTSPLIQATYSGSTSNRTISIGNAGEANAISIDVTAGSDIVVLGSTSAAIKNINFTGFTGSITFGNSISIYGNFDVGGATSLGSTSSPSFQATSGTKTIRLNSLSFPVNVSFNGIGGTWACQDAFSVVGRLTLINGTLQLKDGTTSTVGSFATSGTNQKYLQSTAPGNQATISDASGTNSVSYLTIQDSNATGEAIWDATNTTNVSAGNNTGWIFGYIIDDTHDGDFLGKKFAEEQARAAKRKESILAAYESLVENKPQIAEEIAEPFTALIVDKEKEPIKQIDYDALFADLDRVEAIWSNYIDLDDEEVLALL